MAIRPNMSPEPDPVPLERQVPGETVRAPGEDFYRFAGRVSLGNKLWDSTADQTEQKSHPYGSPGNPYDPLAKFHKKHRMTQAEIIAEGERKASEQQQRELANPTPRATKKRHEQAAMRANARVDAINKRQHIQRKHLELWGPDLWDKDAVETAIKQGQFTRAEKGAIRKAGRDVRRSQRSINRITRRLDKSAAGNDIPGRRSRAVRRILGRG